MKEDKHKKGFITSGNSGLRNRFMEIENSK